MEDVRIATFGGRSFLSLNDASVYDVSEWGVLTEKASISEDFPSLFARCLHDVDGDLEIWTKCIQQSVTVGEGELADAMGAYILLYSTIAQKWRRPGEWSRMISVVKVLRDEQGTKILRTAIDITEDIFQRGFDAPILANQLASLTGQRPRQKASENTALIKFVREMVQHPSNEEVRARLIEHIGTDGWNKFSSTAQELLVDADQLWSEWRFPISADRKDWGSIAILFSRAVEDALVSRFGAACRDLGLRAPTEQPTLGTIVKLLRSAVDGDERSLAAVNNVIHRPIDRELVRRIRKFIFQHRNPAAHPSLYPVEKLDKLRIELFNHSLLRRIADDLL